MTKVRKRSHRVLSFFTAFMILMSALIPILSVVTKSIEVLENSSGREIGKYNVVLMSGAENVGTPDEPDYVWIPTSSARGHRFKFQIDYALSGEGELGRDSVQITIPKHILKDRDGNYADVCELAIPQEDAVPQDDLSNTFVYSEREDYYYI